MGKNDQGNNNQQDQANSNIAAFSARASIKEEAGAWIVKIDQAPLSNQQRQQLQQWVNRSDFHRRYLEKLADNWDAMDILQELADLFPTEVEQKLTNAFHDKSAAATRFTSRINRSIIGLCQRVREQWRSPATWAPALASVALVALMITSWQPSQYQTDIGQQASYQLPDGTRLMLNTNSEIHIDYSRDRRRVELIRGEAHFDVAKNPERPFMVQAGNGVVWAVGTAFNVRYMHSVNTAKAGSDLPGNTEIDVTVTEGTVKIFADIQPQKPQADKEKGNKQPIDSAQLRNQPIVLEQLVEAGKSAQYSHSISTPQSTPATQIEQKLAWQQGALIFKGETLQQAIREIGRYTDQQLVIADPAIQEMRVGGHYKTDNIDQLLVAISDSLNIQIKQQGTQLILTR